MPTVPRLGIRCGHLHCAAASLVVGRQPSAGAAGADTYRASGWTSAGHWMGVGTRHGFPPQIRDARHLCLLAFTCQVCCAATPCTVLGCGTFVVICSVCATIHIHVRVRCRHNRKHGECPNKFISQFVRGGGSGSPQSIVHHRSDKGHGGSSTLLSCVRVPFKGLNF